MVIIGSLMGLVTLGTVGAVVRRYGNHFARRLYVKASGNKLMARARLALTRRKIVLLWPALLPLVSPVWLLSGMGDMALAFVGEYYAAYFLGFLFAYPAGLRKVFAVWREANAHYAAHFVVRRVDAADSMDLLREAAGDAGDERHRKAAVHGLRTLGTRGALALLDKLQADPDASVAEAARQGFEELQGLYAGSNKPLPEASHIVRQVEALRSRRGMQLTKSEFRRNQEMEVQLLGELETATAAQVVIYRSYPHVFCSRCRTRASYQQFEDFRWVECRRCEGVDTLVGGVKQVVGVIGTSTEWELVGTELRLSIWDLATNTPRLADVHLIELVNEVEIRHDWAVSACLEALENGDWKLGQPFKVYNRDQVSLEPNTQRLVERFLRKENTSSAQFDR